MPALVRVSSVSAAGACPVLPVRCTSGVSVGGSDADRLTGLEEASLFAERRIDELHEQVLALSGRLEMLGRRLERLERSLDALGASRGEDEGEGGGDTGESGGFFG